MNDLISRQAAIEATWEEPTYSEPLNVLTEVRDRLKGLPSAQPEQRWIPFKTRPLTKEEKRRASRMGRHSRLQTAR